MALGLGPKKPEGDGAPEKRPLTDASAVPAPQIPSPVPAPPSAAVARTEARESAPEPVKPDVKRASPPPPSAALPMVLEDRAKAREKSMAGHKVDTTVNPTKNRRFGIGFTVTIYVVSSVAVWIFAAWVSTTHASRPWDFTTQRDFTLEQETRGLLKRVNQPLRMTALFGKAGEMRQHVLEEIEALVDLMKVETRDLDYRRIDPDRDPAGTYDLISRLKLENDPQRYRDSVVLEYGAKSSLIPITKIALVELTKEGGQIVPKERAFQGEYAIATAILNLLEEQHAKVYFTAGHGELDGDNPDKDGFQYARAALREEKTVVEPLFLLEIDKVPDDASSVVIAGPIEPFDTQEVVKLEKFIEGGGGLLVCLGPQRFSGLESMLARFGVEFGRDMVVDPANKRAARSPADLIVKRMGNHPIVNSLTTSTLEIANTRSIRRIENAALLDPSLLRTELLWSSEKSWGEIDLQQTKYLRNPEAGDLNGPVCLGMAVNIQPDPSNPKSMIRGGVRIALFGSRELFSNFWLIRSPANGDLFQNTVHWLAKRDRLATVRPKTPSVRLLTVTEQQARWVALTAYVGVPAVFLIAGIWIAWRRRA